MPAPLRLGPALEAHVTCRCVRLMSLVVWAVDIGKNSQHIFAIEKKGLVLCTFHDAASVKTCLFVQSC